MAASQNAQVMQADPAEYIDRSADKEAATWSAQALNGHVMLWSARRITLFVIREGVGNREPSMYLVDCRINPASLPVLLAGR